MIGIIRALFGKLGRRLALWAALITAMLFSLGIAARRGRHAAEAEFLVRRSDARIRALKTAQEVSHEVHNADRSDLDARAQRWMRD